MSFCPCCSRVDLPGRADLCCFCVGRKGPSQPLSQVPQCGRGAPPRTPNLRDPLPAMLERQPGIGHGPGRATRRGRRPGRPDRRAPPPGRAGLTAYRRPTRTRTGRGPGVAGGRPARTTHAAAVTGRFLPFRAGECRGGLPCVNRGSRCARRRDGTDLSPVQSACGKHLAARRTPGGLPAAAAALGSRACRRAGTARPPCARTRSPP
jgi:hypothetical protein